MKKIVLLAAMLLLAIVFGLPGAVGMVAERQHKQLVQQLNRQGTHLTEETYERRWFSSNTRYSYRIEDERLRGFIAGITDEPDGIPVLQVDSKIFHGPVPALSGGLGQAPLAWSDIESNLSLRAPSGKEIPLPGELHSRIEADGSSRFIYHADAESRPLGNGMELRWEQADVDLAIGRGASSFKMDGQIGVVELFDSTAAMQVGPTLLSSNQLQTNQGIWTGDTRIQIGALKTPGFTADALVLETRMRESSGQATYALDLSADKVHGEGFAGSDARAEFFAQRLDAAALAGLLQLMNEHSGSQLPAAQRDALLGRLLQNGPELTMRKLKLPTSSEDIEGDAFISIAPGTGLRLNDVAQNATGNAQFLVPKNVIDHLRRNSPSQVGQVIDLMLQFRFLRADGNRYRIQAKYESGVLTVNGFPVPVPVF